MTKEELAKSCLYVRIKYDATVADGREQVRDVFLLDIDHAYWVTVCDGETVPYRLPREAIKSIKEIPYEKSR